MSGEGILAEHKFKCGVEFFRCHLPSDERPFRKIGRKQCLAHPANRPSFEHRPNPLKDDWKFNAAQTRDFLEWLAGEP